MKVYVYVAYVCGFATIREMGTDTIFHAFKGKRSFEQHLAEAKNIASSRQWELV
jgi:hypothetical protein